jgi:hypothetical protein
MNYNTFLGRSFIQEYYGNHNWFENNVLGPYKDDTGQNPLAAAMIHSELGANNVIYSNRIDGGADGTGTKQIGADDGITLKDESYDFVMLNIANNVWDCGIEPSGTDRTEFLYQAL